MSRSYAYRKRRDRVKRELERYPEKAFCALCGEPIDMTLRAPHPRSFTADHVVPVNSGGNELGILRPAHWGCNSSRKDARRARERKSRKRAKSYRTATDW